MKGGGIRNVSASSRPSYRAESTPEARFRRDENGESDHGPPAISAKFIKAGGFGRVSLPMGARGLALVAPKARARSHPRCGRPSGNSPTFVCLACSRRTQHSLALACFGASSLSSATRPPFWQLSRSRLWRIRGRTRTLPTLVRQTHPSKPNHSPMLTCGRRARARRASVPSLRLGPHASVGEWASYAAGRNTRL